VLECVPFDLLEVFVEDFSFITPPLTQAVESFFCDDLVDVFVEDDGTEAPQEPFDWVDVLVDVFELPFFVEVFVDDVSFVMTPFMQAVESFFCDDLMEVFVEDTGTDAAQEPFDCVDVFVDVFELPFFVDVFVDDFSFVTRPFTHAVVSFFDENELLLFVDDPVSDAPHEPFDFVDVFVEMVELPFFVDVFVDVFSVVTRPLTHEVD
jgi:hypothetical protein